MNLKKITITALLATTPYLSWAHATLVKSEPAKAAQLAASPRAIMLVFNEPLEAAFSSVKLFNQAGKAIATDKTALDATDKKILRTTIPVLVNGTYTVKYSTMGHDGHKRLGEFKFTVQ